MSLAVIDASTLVAYYAAEDSRRATVVAKLAIGDTLFAPAHLDVEIISALRGLSRHSTSVREAVPGALRHLTGFPIRRMPLAPLLQRIWELRENLTAYDAAYVALAERLGSALITCDSTLVAASGPRCRFDLIT